MVWENWLGPFFIEMTMGIMNAVKSILNLIFDVASIEFFKDDVIGSILTRVYIIVGVLMLFKITISCVQYLINPDKAEDKESGFGGIIKRALITVVLLSVVPTLFNFAKTAQKAILEVLPKIVLGTEMEYDMDSVGESLAYTTTLAFFGYSSDECNDGSIAGIAGADSNPKFSTVEDVKNNATVITKTNCGFSGAKRYDFKWYFCLPAAIYMVFMLVSMALDVGVRVIKFGLLEIIAPIPIVSYIDPKTSKKSFDSWLHNSISVYADLFIRLLVIYLVLYLFMILLPSFSLSFKLNDGTTLTTGRSLLVNALIILALLMFAKDAPKFICEILGIKPEGGIGDMFKRAAGFVGTGFAGLRTAKSNFDTQRERLLGKGKSKGAAIAGALKSAAVGAGSATARGLKMATWDKKGFNDVRLGASKAAVEARDARNDRIDNLYSDDYNWLDYIRDKRRADLGIPSSSGFLESRNKNASEIRGSLDAAVNHGLKKLEDFKGTTFTSSKAEGFGSVTDGDGNNVVIRDTSYAYAKKMASLNNGDYYDDGKAAQRQTIFQQKNNDVINLQNDLSNLISTGASAVDINNANAALQRAEQDRDSYRDKFFNAGQNGRAVANEFVTAQWDGIVRNFEKEARFQVESNLLAKADVDAVTQLQKTIGMLKGNIDLGEGNGPTDILIKDVIRSTMGVDSIKDVINILDNGNAKDGYTVSAETLENVRKMSEDIYKLTNQEALIAAERAKRTQQAIQNDKKGS